MFYIAGNSSVFSISIRDEVRQQILTGKEHSRGKDLKMK